MKTHKLLGIAMLAVFAFAAVLAASASAATFLLAEWLVGGSAVTSELLTETIGELLLEDTKTPLGAADVLCSGILDGWVGPNSLNWVTEVLSLNGTAVSSTQLSGTALTCTNQANCEEPLVWAAHLEWESEVELMEDTTTFFADLVKSHSGTTVGWEVECMKSIIGAITDECVSAEGVSELALEGTTLLGNFSRAFTELAGAKLATCSLGGENSGIVEGGGAITLSGGGELTASSESAVS
jgi:hypothetical protein